MAYSVERHPVFAGHYYVNGTLIAGAANKEQAIQIYQDSQTVTD